MTPAEHLRQVKELLTDPSKWTKGAFARSEDGHMRMLSDPDVFSRCASAALRADNRGPYLDSRSFLLDALPYGQESIVTFNDAPGTRHKDIMNWFDRAIALAEAAI